MASGALEHVDEILCEALATPAEARASFLERACGGDVELRREVESLLASAEEMGDDFLAKPVLPPPSPRRPELAEGRRIGPYRISGEIGRGGMGRVYLAVRDDEYEQEVALKVLKRGLDTDEIVRRFRNERQILARLDHPSIARILDGGTTDDGLPYFVMDRVRGEPIDRYCDRRGLSVRARLELFRKVCAAVHFAHQNLIVHRDLKPGNILVTGDGEPRLLDFGIAKLLASDETPMTIPGFQPMTPHYASPEQMLGEPITTASDVYLLGSLLYELLCGRRPARSGHRDDVEAPSRAVESPGGEPSAEEVSRSRGVDPGTLRRRLAGDLDSIVLKALEVEPERRYSSAEQLSEDLRRHLEGLPVLARQATLAYRTAKFVRRHRLGAAVTAAFLLTILGFGVAMTVLWKRAERERERAVAERELAEEVTEFLVDVFEKPDPQASKGDDVTARQLLDERAGSIDEELAGQPETRAVLMNAMGRAYLGLGLYEKAGPLLEESVRLRRESPGTRPDEMATSLLNLAAVHRAGDRLGEAEALAREALEILRRGRADDAEVARAVNNLAGLLRVQGDPLTAEELYREALAMKIRLFGGEHPDVATGKNNLALALKAQGKYEEAEKLYRESLALRIRLHGEVSTEVATTQNNLAALLLEKADLDAAEPLLRENLALRRQVYGAEHAGVTSPLKNLAALLQLRGRYAEAESHYREALAIYRRHFGEEHTSVAGVLRHLAELQRLQGDAAEGEVTARRAVEILRRKLAPGHWRIAAAESVLGGCLLDLGRYVEAEPLLERSYAVIAEAQGEASRQAREAGERLERFDEVRAAPGD